MFCRTVLSILYLNVVHTLANLESRCFLIWTRRQNHLVLSRIVCEWICVCLTCRSWLVETLGRHRSGRAGSGWGAAWSLLGVCGDTRVLSLHHITHTHTHSSSLLAIYPLWYRVHTRFNDGQDFTVLDIFREFLDAWNLKQTKEWTWLIIAGFMLLFVPRV